MFGWIKILIFAAVLGSISLTIFAGYRYVTNQQRIISNLQRDNATMIANIAQYQVALTEQQETITSLLRDIELQSEILNNTNQSFQSARNQVRELQDRLGRHELGYLAYRKPGLVENIVNRASDRVGRCFEIATGAPLTQAELSATLPSQINTECPDIANPNYRRN